MSAERSDNLIRFDMYVGPPVDIFAKPPHVWFTEFPPLPEESSRDYFARVRPLILAPIHQRKWWQFWK